MQFDQLFRRASHHYQNKEYQQGLVLINQCIQREPTNSTLYSNRALYYWQTGNLFSAQQDLNNAIRYDHLNYLAYFNLFSLKVNQEQIYTAFENLCCSLSCLYLIQANKTKKEQDIKTSLKYAINNPEAHILKSLIHFQKQNYEEALKEVQIVFDLHKHIKACLNLKNAINKKLNPLVNVEYPLDLSEQTNFRLHTTYQPSQPYDQQIKVRVSEFNQLYQNIFHSLCPYQIPLVVNKKKQRKIVKQIEDKTGYSPIKLQSQTATKQNLPNQDSLLSQNNQMNGNEETSLDLEPQFNKQQIINYNDSQLSQHTPQKSNISALSSNSEPVNLYPIKQKKKIQFTAISAFFEHKIQKAKDVYLIGSYNSKKGQTIKTLNKKLQNRTVQWFTSAIPTDLSESVQKLTISIYSKQYFAVSDRLLGQGTMSVSRSGEISCPIYFNHEYVGTALIRIDII